MEERPKICVLLAPGINCDNETAFALELAGAIAERIHVNDLISKKARLSDFHGLVLPGGFSFGDDVASGKILGNKLKYLLRSEIDIFINEAKPVLGICNGFQVMVKMGLLPGFNSNYWEQQVTLTFNASNKFENRWVHLKADKSTKCVFTKGLERLVFLPVRHGEGRLIAKEDAVLEKLTNNGHVALRYVDEKGERGRYPVNPNGSVDDIAGLTDETGLLFGLMPHPEAFVRKTQHPKWTSAAVPDEGDGLLLFTNMVEHIRENLL